MLRRFLIAGIRHSMLLLICLTTILHAKAAHAQDFSKETIYFIVVDRFYDGDPHNNPTGAIFSPDKSEWKLYWGGDIQGVIDKLPYIRRMGFTAIWLTPLIANTESLYLYDDKENRKSAAYHGYWGRDWYQINRFFGTKEKFKELIDKAHAMGIKVIFDYVLNHTSPVGQGINGAIYRDGIFIADYSNDPHGWFHHNGSIDFSKNDLAEWQNKNLYDLADLNSENPAVEKYLIDAAKMWMRMGIDGFRLDTVRHIPLDFATRFAQAIKKDNPKVFLFGEWSMGGLADRDAVQFTRQTGINLIDFQFTQHITDAICRGRSFKAIAQYIENDRKVKHPEWLVTCIDNHDMPRFISTAIANGADPMTARKKTELATYIMMVSRGIPCIYYGTEQYLHVGRSTSWGYGGEPYNRQMMAGWHNFNGFARNIKRLAELRRKVSAVSRGEQVTLVATENVWVFERRDADSVLLVAANKGKRQKVRVANTRLPDGIYRANGVERVRVMGPNIAVRHRQVRFELGQYEIGIWYAVTDAHRSRRRR